MRIHFDVTAHGFGHLAMTSMVMRAMLDHRPAHQLSLGVDYPEVVLLQFFSPRELAKITIIHGPFDPAIPMDGPLQVNVPKTTSIYQEAMHHAPDILRSEEKRLQPISPDILVSNVSPWPLAALADWDIKRIAFSSLDWANQLKFMGLEAEGKFVEELYSAAHLFIAATPHAPLITSCPIHEVSPIGRRGQNIRPKIKQRLSNKWLILQSFGGLGGQQPSIEGLEPDDADIVTPIICANLGFSFIDLLASCDLVLTKPGYGTYVEAVLHQKPVMTWPRPDWLEAKALNQFLLDHGAKVTPHGGDVSNMFLKKLANQKVVPIGVTGETEVVDLLLG